MNEVLRQVYKGIAYCYFHPEEITKKKHLEEYVLKAWNLGVPRITFDKGSNEIAIGDMTIWEIAYALKDVTNVNDICH